MLLKTLLSKKNKDKIIWMDSVKVIQCGEVSHSHIDSYQYSYVLPHTIETCNGRQIHIDALPHNDLTGAIQIANGVTIHKKTHRPIYGTRETVYEIQIQPSACPIKILYHEGSGEGGAQTDYFESNNKSYWITYQSKS